MDIQNSNSLQQSAQHALRRGREPKKVVLTFAVANLVISLALTLLDLWLSDQISGTGGLSQIGTRAIFSTAQSVLSYAGTIIAMCLNLGFRHAMMRIARGQYADHTDLKVGFQRFFPLLRLTLLQGIIYLGIILLVYQVVAFIYALTPWGESMVELIYPIMVSGDFNVDDATFLQMIQLLIPFLIGFAALGAAALIPFCFWFRMSHYTILDDPRHGAFAALRASRKMMRGNCFHLFRLDLRLWAYHLLIALSSLSYYSVFLLYFVELPIDSTVFSWVTYAVALALQFAADYFLRAKAEVSYVMAYECIHEKPQDNGAVLGNIFDM